MMIQPDSAPLFTSRIPSSSRGLNAGLPDLSAMILQPDSSPPALTSRNLNSWRGNSQTSGLDLSATVIQEVGPPLLTSRPGIGSRRSTQTPPEEAAMFMQPDGSSVLASLMSRQESMGSQVDEIAAVMQSEVSPLLTSQLFDSRLSSKTQLVHPDGASAAVPPALHDFMSRFRETIAQDLQNSLEVMQRLEADVALMTSTMQGLQNDVDRQQVQITDLVQSRLTASDVQERAAREKDLEMSQFMEKIIKDIDTLRNQQRRGSATEPQLKGDQHQKADQRLIELQKDLEMITSEVIQVKSVQQNMEKMFSDTGSARRRTNREVEESRQSIMNELKMHKEHLASHRDHQQKLETVILDMRRELQGAQTDLARTHADFSLHKEDLAQQLTSYNEELSVHKDEFSSHKEDLKLHKDELSLHKDEFQKCIEDLDMQKTEFHKRATGFSGMHDAFAAACTETIQQAIQHMQRSQHEWQHSQQQKLIELDGLVQETLKTKDRLHKLEAKQEEFCLTLASNRASIPDLTQVVNAERAARIELSTALDTYRYAHLETTSEIRAALSGQSERLASLESVSVLERGLSDKTMREIEVRMKQDSRSVSSVDQRVNELKDLLQAEANARMEISSFMEAYHAANLKTCTEFRNDLSSLQEVVQKMDTAQHQVLDGHTELQRDHQEQKRICDAHIKNSTQTCEDLRLKIDSAHANLQQLQMHGSAEKDVQGLAASITSERAARKQLERQLESSIAVSTKSRMELRADIEIAVRKLTLLETMVQDQQASQQESTIQAIGQELLQLRELVTDENRAEAQEARVEVLETRGSLGAFRSSLQTIASELQKERQTRIREAFEFQDALRQLQDKLHITLDNHSQHASYVEQLEGSLRELEKTTSLLSARSHSGHSARSHASAENLLRERLKPKHTPRPEEDFQAICEKLDTFEPSLMKETSWRRQAVQDVENVLDGLSHLSPRPTMSNSMLPTLATALRLSKAGEAEAAA